MVSPRFLPQANPMIKLSNMMIEGSLEVKLLTIWTVGKAEVGRVTEEKKEVWRHQRRGREGRKKRQVRKKVGKRMFFQWFVAPEGRTVGSLKRRVRSHVVRWEMKKCTPLWRAHFQVKKLKAPHVRSTFRSCDVEKAHGVVARSTFPSQNAQSTPFSDHFWKLRCSKSARCCEAKHMSKSKGTKHTNVGPLLEVEMSKMCTPLWREAHFEVKSVKNWRSQTTFGNWNAEKVHTLVARSTFGSQKCQKPRLRLFWRSDVKKSAR